MPIGVFDSGLGGLTILGACRAALPGQDFVYLGDNLNAPYGIRSPADIYNLTIAGVERLFAEAAASWSSPATPPPPSHCTTCR